MWWMWATVALAGSPGLAVRCAAGWRDAVPEDVAAVVEQLSSHLPADGALTITGVPALAGTRVEVRATVADDAAFDAWLASYAFTPFATGEWRNPDGDWVRRRRGAVTVGWTDPGTLVGASVALPAVRAPKTGCVVQFRHPAAGPLTVDAGVAIAISTKAEATVRLRLDRGIERWVTAVGEGRVPDWKLGGPETALVALNVADPAVLLAGKGVVSPRIGAVLAQVAGEVRPGVRISVDGDRTALWVPLAPGRAAAFVGAAPDGLLQIKDNMGEVYAAAVGDALLVSQRRAMVEAGRNQAFVDSSREPGVQVIAANGTRASLVAAGPDLVVSAASPEVEKGLHNLTDGGASLSGNVDALPWPLRAPSDAKEVVCHTRAIVGGGAGHDVAPAHLAVWGCPPAFEAAVRASAVAWQGAGSALVFQRREVASDVTFTPPRGLRAVAPIRVRDYQTRPSGLKFAEIAAGDGVSPTRGQEVLFDWMAWRADGTPIGGSYVGSGPTRLRLGGGWGLPAWEEALLEMKPGGVSQIVAPPALAYGAAGRPPDVPANETVTFELKLRQVDPPTITPEDGGLLGALHGETPDGPVGIGDDGPAVPSFAPSPSAPTVTDRVPRVTGDADPAAIHLVLKRQRSALRYCYERALVKNPTLSGEISVKFVIDAEGKVLNAVGAAPEALAPLRQCVEARIFRAAFRPFEQGVAVVDYTLEFRLPK
jgi:hypothetical protein